MNSQTDKPAAEPAAEDVTVIYSNTGGTAFAVLIPATSTTGGDRPPAAGKTPER